MQVLKGERKRRAPRASEKKMPKREQNTERRNARAKESAKKDKQKVSVELHE